jgi:hypothetical protein
MVLLTAFLALSGYALYDHGVCGFMHAATANTATIALTTDLAIALSMVGVWLWRDARARGVSPWPYLLLTAVLGSAGPLLYLAMKAAGASGSCCGGTPRATV